MTQPAADMTLARLIASMEQLLAGVPGARLEDDVAKAIASLLPVASGGHQEVAARLLEIVPASSDPLFLQSVGGVFGAIDWASVDHALVQQWRRYVRDNLAGATDHRFVAAALLRSLPDGQELRTQALDAFRAQPDLLTAANSLALGPVPKAVADRIAKLVRGTLRATREDAARGSHGFGSFVDGPLLITHVLMEYQGTAGWADLVSFLMDRNVASAQKSASLMEILNRPETVPSFVHARLGAWVSRPVLFNQLPMESGDEFRAVILRLRLRYRARAADALLAELLDMATSSERIARREAAASLPFALGTAPPPTLMTLAVTLSRDVAWDVRGAAARALPAITSAVEEPLASIGWQRVAQALSDPGSRVPLWVLSGLWDAAVASSLPSNVRSLIDNAALNHLSHRVRQAASRIATNAEAAAAPREPPNPPAAHGSTKATQPR